MNAIEKAILRPFSFSGGGFEESSRCIAEDQAIACESSASYFEKSGRSDLASEQRKKAESWRGLATLSETQAKPVCDALFLKGVETLDELLALAEKRDTARSLLVLLADKILSGLLDSATRRDKRAAHAFMQSISVAVNNFEFVAMREPEVFREWARGQIAIPGLISRNRAQSRDNARLLEVLQQGEATYIAPGIRNKRGRFWTFSGANLVAVRLISHIQSSNISYESDKSLARHFRRDLPSWRKEAVKLKGFSSRTWLNWAQVIWQMIIEMSPKKKPALHPAFYDPKTKICNVRKTRNNPYYGNEERAYSISEQDIKEALFGAVEIIATGESRRSKQRRKAREREIR